MSEDQRSVNKVSVPAQGMWVLHRCRESTSGGGAAPKTLGCGGVVPSRAGRSEMFGKTRETNEMDTPHGPAPAGEFFGDEAAAEEAASVDQLRDRVEAVEAQINSQFTSLATYAQIAQEQVELARAEARSHTERAEQRVTSLIERARADRVQSITGEAPAGSVPDVTARLGALEHSVALLRRGLDECLARQKQLADAITTLFDRDGSGSGETLPPPAVVEGEPLAPPAVDDAADDDRHDDDDDDGPMELSIPPLPAPGEPLPAPSTPASSHRSVRSVPSVSSAPL